MADQYSNRKNGKVKFLRILILALLLLAVVYSFCSGSKDKTPAAEKDSLDAAPDTFEQLAGQPENTPAKAEQVEPPAAAEEPKDSARQPRLIGKGLYLLVIKDKFELRLYADGKLAKTYPVALGKNSGDKQKVGDSRTPEGHFHISQIQDSHTWTHDFKGDDKGPIAGAYGPWFLRLYTGRDATFSGQTWTGIAIHGTHDPASIGTLASEGCIRLKNDDIADLKARVQTQKNVPVDILESVK